MTPRQISAVQQHSPLHAWSRDPGPTKKCRSEALPNAPPCSSERPACLSRVVARRAGAHYRSAGPASPRDAAHVVPGPRRSCQQGAGWMMAAAGCCPPRGSGGLCAAPVPAGQTWPPLAPPEARLARGSRLHRASETVDAPRPCITRGHTIK
eukprot:177617-Prorocentrum_minimum.AAC.1